MLLKKWQLSHLGMKFAEKSMTIWLLNCQLLLFKIKYTGYIEVHRASQHDRPGHAGESTRPPLCRRAWGSWGCSAWGRGGLGGPPRAHQQLVEVREDRMGSAQEALGTAWRLPRQHRCAGCWALCRDREVLGGLRGSSGAAWGWALLGVGGHPDVPPTSTSQQVLWTCEVVLRRWWFGQMQELSLKIGQGWALRSSSRNANSQKNISLSFVVLCLAQLRNVSFPSLI